MRVVVVVVGGGRNKINEVQNHAVCSIRLLSHSPYIEILSSAVSLEQLQLLLL
jgi:hypothetical protein